MSNTTKSGKMTPDEDPITIKVPVDRSAAQPLGSVQWNERKGWSGVEKLNGRKFVSGKTGESRRKTCPDYDSSPWILHWMTEDRTRGSRSLGHEEISNIHIK